MNMTVIESGDYPPDAGGLDEPAAEPTTGQDAESRNVSALTGSGSLTVHYGIRVLDIDETLFCAIGHYTDRRRVVAAMNAHARGLLNWDSLRGWSERGDDYPQIASALEERFAVVVDEDDSEYGSFDSDDPASRVVMKAEFTADTPGAFPVTVWGG